MVNTRTDLKAMLGLLWFNELPWWYFSRTSPSSCHWTEDCRSASANLDSSHLIVASSALLARSEFVRHQDISVVPKTGLPMGLHHYFAFLHLVLQFLFGRWHSCFDVICYTFFPWEVARDKKA
jgi:hypothetical protein